MFSFFAKPKPVTAVINDTAITVNPKETLLQAALRQGIDFPHSCRVGGCASCKCQLVEGQVKELTQTAYILSDEDLDRGCILACQAVPKTDVRVRVDLARQGARRRVNGRVIAQDRLTHDIVRLRVQLDEALPYKAGQFAQIGVAGLPGVERSYSFASPAQPDAQVSFFVRRVDGGVFSTAVNEQNLVGQTATVDGPLGDFWLRPGTGPLLMVAGGSGLAPILALLQDARAQGVARPVTLLFGARTQADLYALDTLQDLARQWPSAFTFTPVLSDEPAGSGWDGARGWVTAQLPAQLAPDTQAYLCGPPPMIDAAEARLRDAGLARDHIHADRFTTLHDVPAAA